MSAQEKVLERSSLIDALRGLAVAGMMTAHGIFFFHDTSQPVLNTLQGLLNITVFTIFLFVSGLATSRWIYTLSETTPGNRVRKIIFKLASLYIGYAMVAAAAVLTSGSEFSIDTGNKIAAALLFLSPPNFTEYFLLFVSITLLILPFFSILKKLQHSLPLIIVVSIISYLLGFLLYPLTLPPLLNELKALLAGGDGLLRFPLLFYMPVFLLGLWWQQTIDSSIKSSMPKVFVILKVIFILTVVISNVWTRWPPSPGNLALGLSLGTMLLLFLPHLQKPLLAPVYQLLTVLGRHSMDLWILHLLLLLGYARFVGIQYGEFFRVILGVFSLFSLTIALSALTIRSQPSFLTLGPFGIAEHKRKQFQTRYLFFFILMGLLLMVSLNRQSTSTTNSIYGNVMPTPQILSKQYDYSGITQSLLTTDRKWYVRLGTRSDTVQVTLQFKKTDNSNEIVNIDDVAFFLDNNGITEEKILKSDGSIQVLFSSSNLVPGEHSIEARLTTKNIPVVSNTATILITEPLYVAWTFDWEGWDVSDQALQQISFFSGTYGLPFSHFVSPRTFVDGVLPEKRKQELIGYLLDRYQAGDELAMHLHMHFDFVTAAGIIPKKSKAWGLRSNEGYDVPTSEYTPEEFRTLIQYGKTLTKNAGFPEMKGYRAGGWFITAPLLQILEEEGFFYDSSGRDKPAVGAFRTVPWNLPIDSTPYFPDVFSQNSASDFPRRLMEIPNTGGSTYDLSAEELIARISQVYTQTVLTEPKVIVFVSHPQFASREFGKIPKILSHLQQISRDKDKGPVLFTTTSQIHSLWETYLP